MLASARIDFGYPWWLSYGHIVVLIPSLVLLGLAFHLRWSKPLLVLFGALGTWSAASMLVVHLLNINGVTNLPTQKFLTSGIGRVLDIGAGTGRSSIMVLQGRPKATLVASDLFGESFKGHFGDGPSPQKRLLANLQAAGVADRATIETADMLQLPFDSASFDAVVSAYAMEHVGPSGSKKALTEAARVLKPGGDLLLILVANDGWAKFAFGPMLTHGGIKGQQWWSEQAQAAGFQEMERGTYPFTQYFLLRQAKPAN